MGEFGGLVFLGGLGTAAYQAYGWLRTGLWVPLELRDLTRAGVFVADTGWLGADQIFRWMGNQSIALAVCILGALIMIVAAIDER